MGCLTHTRRELCQPLCLLVCLAGHSLGCAPSRFDELSSQSVGEPRCASSGCLDGGSRARDAGRGGDADAQPDAATEADGGLEPSEAAAEDGSVDPGMDTPDSDDADTDAGPILQGPCDGGTLACEPNQPDPHLEPCGLCDSGVRSHTRVCAADGCSWGAWSDWSDCTGVHVECDPAAPPEPRMVSCTTCGMRAQARSCAPDTCTWLPWIDTSACTWCNECSEVVYCRTPASIADRGTWCRQKACSREQALGNCLEDVQDRCGTITEPFFMEYL